MRGVWVASVRNIDWPTQPNPNSAILKREFRELAAHHQATGINALVVQVRPATDAFYPSEFEPWSEWLTGEQGMSPEPQFDPVHFMIEETHNRGMEFHAWFNPYRAIVQTDSAITALNHITRLRPGWFVKYGDNTYFDPGIPEARDYLIEVIGEVVRKYDLDAIHFDDYFYPYKIAGIDFPDSASFARYGRDFINVEDWRRNNVNVLIQGLHDEIKSIKPYVKFGISPFGVWRNKEKDPTGSDTKAGQTNYDDLYADVLLWMKNDWIDYIVPQIYWHIGFELADYAKLVDWWDQNTFGKHMYIGQASYRIGNHSAEEWKNPSEMHDHLRLNTSYSNISGNIYFNSTSLLNNPLGFTDSLKADWYSSPAIVPPMPWIDNDIPASATISSASALSSGIELNWNESSSDDISYTLIYRFRGNQEVDISNASRIIAKVRYPDRQFRDPITRPGKYTYVVTFLDRNNNESLKSDSVVVKIPRFKTNK